MLWLILKPIFAWFLSIAQVPGGKGRNENKVAITVKAGSIKDLFIVFNCFKYYRNNAPAKLLMVSPSVGAIIK